MIRFLSNDGLWAAIRASIRRGKHTDFAVAFLSSGGADLLPLKKGDRLVLNMSIDAVKQGLTDPREVRRLMRRGVRVYWRRRVHAKFVIAGRTLIVSSANGSRSSQKNLDEAGILTEDLAALRRAAAFFEKMCSEPVLPRYLESCFKAYRPPKFSPGGGKPRRSTNGVGRIVEAKLWFLGKIGELLDEDELASAEDQAEELKTKLRLTKDRDIDWIQYDDHQDFFKQLRFGDWAIYFSHDRTVPHPGEYRKVARCKGSNGKAKWRLFLECPANCSSMGIGTFKKRVRHLDPGLAGRRTRMKPIRDDETADAILRMWTASGSVSRRGM